MKLKLLLLLTLTCAAAQAQTVVWKATAGDGTELALLDKPCELRQRDGQGPREVSRNDDGRVRPAQEWRQARAVLDGA